MSHRRQAIALLIVLAVALALARSLEAQRAAGFDRELTLVGGSFHDLHTERFSFPPGGPALRVADVAPGFMIGARGARFIHRLLVVEGGLSYAAVRFDPLFDAPPDSTARYGLADAMLAVQVPAGPLRPFVGSGVGFRVEDTPYRKGGALFLSPIVAGARLLLPRGLSAIVAVRTWQLTGHRRGDACTVDMCGGDWMLGLGHRFGS